MSRATTPTPTSSPRPWTARSTRSRWSTTWGCCTTRKSNLDKAGVQPPTTIDELIAASLALNTKDQRGLFIGNDAGVTPSFGGGSLLGQSCGQWAATIRPPTTSRVSPHLTSSSRSRRRASCSCRSRSCSVPPTAGGIPPRSPRVSRPCNGAGCGQYRASRRPSLMTSASWPGRPSADRSASRRLSSAVGRDGQRYVVQH
jgi:hypothetical protein